MRNRHLRSISGLVLLAALAAPLAANAASSTNPEIDLKWRLRIRPHLNPRPDRKL